MYSNTIVNQESKHYRYEAMIRNHFIRNENQYPHIGAMISNGPSITKLHTILETINSKDRIIKDQEEQIKRLSDEITLIYSSKSWKYTGILRQLKQKLFKKKTNA